MERTPTIVNVDAQPCGCCGAAITAEWADATGGSCERCAGFPFTMASHCGGVHGDALRMKLIGQVRAGHRKPMEAVALAATDDAHRAGLLREGKNRLGCAIWVIDRAAPDPEAWERLERMATVDRTIHEVVSMFVGDKASRPWAAAEVRKVLVARLSWLSRHAGCSGIWRIEVASPVQIDIQPPADYINPDTAVTRSRATVDGLVREALVT